MNTPCTTKLSELLALLACLSFLFSSGWVELAPDCSHYTTYTNHRTLCVWHIHTHTYTVHNYEFMPESTYWHLNHAFHFLFHASNVLPLFMRVYDFNLLPCWVVCASINNPVFIVSYSEQDDISLFVHCLLCSRLSPLLVLLVLTCSLMDLGSFNLHFQSTDLKFSDRNLPHSCFSLKA